MKPLTAPQSLDEARQLIKEMAEDHRVKARKLHEQADEAEKVLSEAGLRKKTDRHPLRSFAGQHNRIAQAFEVAYARLSGRYTDFEIACYTTPEEWDRLFKEMEGHHDEEPKLKVVKE